MDLPRWPYLYNIISILLIWYCDVTSCTIQCTPGIETAGYTFPQGDILIEYGDPLDLLCIVPQNTDVNASSLIKFTRSGTAIEPEMVDVVNVTTARLHIDKPGLTSQDYYMCEFNGTTVCSNVVAVAVKPKLVTDFKCIAQNFDNLTCTWTAPENYIRTDYKLSFIISERAARFAQAQLCQHIRTLPNNKQKMSCMWNDSTVPPYRPVHENFNFTLSYENKLGKGETNVFFNHYANVLPGPPENLSVINTTSSSIALKWNIPLLMKVFVPGVHVRILYQCEYDEKKWQLATHSMLLKSKLEGVYVLNGLKHAHALCDIRVSLRSARALPNDESMWSRNASITVRTNSTIPERPPETVAGSFEIIASGTNLQIGDVYIYWKQIPDEQKNGADFRYAIKGSESELVMNYTKSSYFKVFNLSMTKSYIFDIWSVNENGRSSRSSKVHIPPQNRRIKEPASFSKVEWNSNVYELNWDPPKLLPTQHLTNYTIVTCKSDRERPYQCNGMLNWIIVPSGINSTNVSITTDKVLQFAISANTEDSSSGMLWAGCTIIRKNIVGKIKNVWINRVGSTYIEVGWKLDCSDQIGSVAGYIVYYCPLKSPAQADCRAAQQNSTFDGKSLNGNITNLQPYTTYMLSVVVKTKHNSFSQQSDPLFNTTNESAPTVPHLKIHNVTNSTIFVKWSPPETMNGKLKYYELDYHPYNGLDSKPKEIELETHFMLTNLSSYQHYKISVRACTTSCSEKSTAYIITNMTYPGKIDKPKIDNINDSSMTIIWNKPARPGGKLDYYIIRLKRKHKHTNDTSEHNTTNDKYVFENCADNGVYNTYYFAVRAVNTINGKDHKGPWSDELENYCSSGVNILMYIIICGGVIGVCAIGFCSVRLHRQCKIMRDVEVKLPPGLAPVINDVDFLSWNTEKHHESRTNYPPPDEEFLLNRMSEVIHFSGDSSGCSSGQESVTSSLESGTHISSTSDSGTEQIDNYTKDSARLSITTDVLKVEDPSPYVMTGEAVKPVNPGYIVFNQTEPVDKNSGYVVAGLKNINGYIPFNQTENVGRNTGYVVTGNKNCKLD